jgi:putative sterol carrier protein
MDFPETTTELFEQMPRNFRPEVAGDLNAVIQFDLTGDGGGTWTADIGEGKCQVAQGPADNPTLTLTMDAREYLAMCRGDLNAMTAFMLRKIKLSGDVGLAMKLQSLFGLG